MMMVVIAMIGVTLATYDSDGTANDADARQADRQEEILAREIAKSGLNMILTQARTYEVGNADPQVQTIVAAVNGGDGAREAAFQGGSYRAWLEPASSTTYHAISVGTFGDATYQIGRSILSKGTLEIDEPSTLEVTFEESMAGYCSAIYLQRVLPTSGSGKSNNGHGNNADGVDSSNPGKSKQGEDSDPTVDDETKGGKGKGKGKRHSGSDLEVLEPELIFAPGNNRDGAEAEYATTLMPGTRINFILAVDADYSCEERGQAVDVDHKTYDYTRSALKTNVSQLDEMEEGSYVLIQQHPSNPKIWRLAFEDLVFPEDKLVDVKANGYGSTSWDSKKKTYGGSGWTDTDANGFWKLKNYGGLPDFSDQVIRVEVVPVGPEA